MEMQSSLKVSGIANRKIFDLADIEGLVAVVEVGTKRHSLQMAGGGGLVARIEEERNTVHGSHRWEEVGDFVDVAEAAAAAETETAVVTERKWDGPN